MDTLTFLSRIFAQQDELVICTHRPDPSGKDARGIFWNRGSFSDLTSAVKSIHKWDKEPDTTVYFTVGACAGHSFTKNGKTKWRRTAEHATWFKALSLDLDIGADKPYATQREGWLALRTALEDIGMPLPMVVSSGNGIHCHWPLTDIIAKAHWVQASMALRFALEDKNVVIDVSKIHEPSMVLRPVGTHHKKQKPWKEVTCVADCPDYDAAALLSHLRPWFGRAREAVKKGVRRPGRKSAIAAAVLSSNDVDIAQVGSRCKQVGALLSSGGVTDAAGRPVEEPLWRASLGMAKHATDVQAAVTAIAGRHADFDLSANMDKINGWNGTGPTTCAKFEEMCVAGCEGCPFRGKITSPAQLTASTTTAAPADATPASTDTEEVSVQLPNRYVERGGKIYLEIETEVESTDANGNAITQTAVDWELVSPYPMHITGIYKDSETGKSMFRLVIKYPLGGWQEEAHDMGVLAAAGRDFSSFMLHRQVFAVKVQGQQERLRSYLMDYLTMVQSQAPTSKAYNTFGWQDDDTFLCGSRISTDVGVVDDQRIQGQAEQFATYMQPVGTRQGWVDAMKMLDTRAALTIRCAVLLGMTGVLGRAAGNSTAVVSIYSNETTTGKSLSLYAANSLIGHPRDLLLNKRDTVNAMFKVRGILNSLPCTMDEITTMDEQTAVSLIYAFSEGREKIALDQYRNIRTPSKWAGPTIVTTNTSLVQKFSSVQSNDDPLRARTLEIPQHDRDFISKDEEGFRNRGDKFYMSILKNYGWALPELAHAVAKMGGEESVLNRGRGAFNKKYQFDFEAKERFHTELVTNSWIMGTLAQRLGLIPFDVDETVEYMYNAVLEERVAAEASRQDVFDILGQFMQENNNRIIEVLEEYGSNKEQVLQPAPDKAIARLKLVYDANNKVLPGSQLAINLKAFREWLGKTNDNMDRIIRELDSEGGLVSARERITMFKGCSNRNPGQAHCVIVNMNHSRFVEAMLSDTAKISSPVALAVLNGGK